MQEEGTVKTLSNGIKVGGRDNQPPTKKYKSDDKDAKGTQTDNMGGKVNTNEKRTYNEKQRKD